MVGQKICCVPCLCSLMSFGLCFVIRLCAILGLKSVATQVCADQCPLASVWFFLLSNLDKWLNCVSITQKLKENLDQRVIRITQKLKENLYQRVIRITHKLKEAGKIVDTEKLNKKALVCG